MKRLDRLYRFLEKHHQWNIAFQTSEYSRYLTHCETPKQRLIALLHLVAHTQSQPKLGPLADFWRHLEGIDWGRKAPWLEDLTAVIEKAGSPSTVHVGPWDRLFHSLNSVDGWGPKTSALFVKALIGLHRTARTDLYCIRDEAAAQVIADSDRIYLPVDVVIRRVFKTPELQELGKTFGPINTALYKAGYTPEQMLVWDDLWFWGFFTQDSSTDDRVMGWNEARFWGQLSSPKADLPEVRELCRRFLQIVNV